jgi:hypothetical protein
MGCANALTCTIMKSERATSSLKVGAYPAHRWCPRLRAPNSLFSAKVIEKLCAPIHCSKQRKWRRELRELSLNIWRASHSVPPMFRPNSYHLCIQLEPISTGNCSHLLSGVDQVKHGKSRHMVIHPDCTGLGRRVVLNNGPNGCSQFSAVCCLGLKMALHPSMLFECDYCQ